MLTDDFKARLERLNRERFIIGAPGIPMGASTDAAAEHTLAAATVANHLDADLSLTALIPGEIHENASGPHYVIRQALVELDGAFDARLAAGAERMRCGHIVRDALHPELAALAERFPQGTLFLDLETCGFAGSPIFLVGLLHHGFLHDGRQGMVLEQLLARDYTEERSVLETLWRRAADNRVLVTFNGKSFDWPMVRDRSTYHRLDAAHSRRDSDANALDRLPALIHCDLLHHARRRWRMRLPNCKLQTLERFVCRRLRRDDIAGSQIPQEYHHFVRTGDARRLGSILEHNALDLLTLAELALRVAE